MSLLCIAVKKARIIGNVGQCNSYVSLKLQNVKSTTVTVKGNNPSWEQDFIFETNRMDTGLVIELWNKGVLWDKLLGCHWLPLLNIQYSNEEGEGKWLSLEAEFMMKDGEVIGTKSPTGSTILIDARFELPYDLQDAEAMELQRKLEVLNTIMDQEILTLKEQARRATLSMHSGMSEDSDYTSDVNYPVGQHANCSASQYLNNVGQMSEFSGDGSRQNSYERDYSYDPACSFEEYNDGRRSDTESEPLYYNSRPRDSNYSYSPPRYPMNLSRQSTQDYVSDEYDQECGNEVSFERRSSVMCSNSGDYHGGRRPSLERQSSFDHEHSGAQYSNDLAGVYSYCYQSGSYYYNEQEDQCYNDDKQERYGHWDEMRVKERAEREAQWNETWSGEQSPEEQKRVLGNNNTACTNLRSNTEIINYDTIFDQEHVGPQKVPAETNDVHELVLDHLAPKVDDSGEKMDACDGPKPTPRMRWLSAFSKVCAQLNVSKILILKRH